MRPGAYLSFLVRAGELIGQRESQAWRHILGQFYSCLQCHKTLLMLVLLGYIGLIIATQYRLVLPSSVEDGLDPAGLTEQVESRSGTTFKMQNGSSTPLARQEAILA